MAERYIIFSLRDSYITYGKQTISSYEPFSDVEPLKFLPGTLTYQHFWNHPEDICDNILTIVIPGLRYKYLDYINFISESERPTILNYLLKPLPSFDYIENKFVMSGTLNGYDVVYMRADDFVTALNKREEISMAVYPFTLILRTKEYDFYDEDRRELLSPINIPC